MSKMTVLTPQERLEVISISMQGLIGNGNFQQFMDVLREMRHAASLDMVTEAVTKDSRLTLVAAGEVRALDSIIGIYDNYVDQRVQMADVEVA